MRPLNNAAWIGEPKGKLTVDEAPYPIPAEDEIIVKVWKPRLLFTIPQYSIERVSTK
jgi:hypothetical protein